MDTACLDYCLTEDERLDFERNGFLIVPDALTPQMTSDIEAVVDRIDAHHRTEAKMESHEWVHKLDFVGQDEVFLDLLDWHKTFPKVWGILGWNIQLYLTHMDVTPPPPSRCRAGEAAVGLASGQWTFERRAGNRSPSTSFGQDWLFPYRYD